MGRANHKLRAMTTSKFFERGNFCGKKYRRLEDQKLRPGLVLTRILQKGEGLKDVLSEVV